jgi:hypothetical protein
VPVPFEQVSGDVFVDGNVKGVNLSMSFIFTSESPREELGTTTGSWLGIRAGAKNSAPMTTPNRSQKAKTLNLGNSPA